MVTIKLNELIDAMQFHSDLESSFINLKTGEICFVSDEATHIVEGEDQDYPEWQQADIDVAKCYLENPEGFLALPSQWDVDEYRMMEDFASDIDDEKIAGQLFISLKGKGAFRRFKDSVILLGIEKDWYAFREERYKQFAMEWCEDNGITLYQGEVSDASTN